MHLSPFENCPIRPQGCFLLHSQIRVQILETQKAQIVDSHHQNPHARTIKALRQASFATCAKRALALAWRAESSPHVNAMVYFLEATEQQKFLDLLNSETKSAKRVSTIFNCSYTKNLILKMKMNK